jgi:hypothetical protein
MDSEVIMYVEKLIEAFPCCLIAIHFLYFEAPQNKNDLYLTYLSLLVSLFTTSIPSSKDFLQDFFSSSIYITINCSNIIC